MANRSDIINTLRKAYPDVDNCLLPSTGDAHVVDAGISQFSADANIPGFDISNPNNRPMFLLQIDGKLLTSSMRKVGQCDCAIVSDNEISFVEFKTNAIVANDSNCDKAELQIFTTIMRINWALSRAGASLVPLANLESYVCFKSYPAVNAELQSRQLRFFNNTGVPLCYSNKKTL